MDIFLNICDSYDRDCLIESGYYEGKFLGVELFESDL